MSPKRICQLALAGFCLGTVSALLFDNPWLANGFSIALALAWVIVMGKI